MKKKFLKKLMATVGVVAIMGSSLMCQEAYAADKVYHETYCLNTAKGYIHMEVGDTYVTAITECDYFTGKSGVLDTSVTYYAYYQDSMDRTESRKYTSRKVFTETSAVSKVSANMYSGYKIYAAVSNHNVKLYYNGGPFSGTMQIKHEK